MTTSRAPVARTSASFALHAHALTALALSVAAIVTTTGCVPRYSAKPPLAFADFDYSGPDKKPWPLSFAALPETAKTYALQTVPKVAYVELNRTGNQGTLVFIHGLGSYLKFWWFQLDAYAAQGWHVVALDLPGYGKSDKPASFPYTMEAMADAARELMRTLGVVHPVVIGHSMGGQTALSWAIRYPQEVRALVLTSPAGLETFTQREQAWFVRVFTRALVTHASEYAIWGSVAQGNFARFRPELQWLIEERVRVAKSEGFEAYAYAQVRSVQGLAHNDFVRQNLDKVRAPTLLAFGEDDRFIPSPFLHGGFPRTFFEEHARAIPQVIVQGFPRCGHSVQLDCPVEYGAAVTAFLKGLPKSLQGPASK